MNVTSWFDCTVTGQSKTEFAEKKGNLRKIINIRLQLRRTHCKFEEKCSFKLNEKDNKHLFNSPFSKKNNFDIPINPVLWTWTAIKHKQFINISGWNIFFSLTTLQLYRTLLLLFWSHYSWIQKRVRTWIGNVIHSI